MLQLRIILILSLLAACEHTTSDCKTNYNGTLSESIQLRVTKIADGDTFTGCVMPGGQGKIKVRVLGIDCPESRKNAKCDREGKNGGESCLAQIPKGQIAKKRALELLQTQTIRLESPMGDGNFRKDPYGRLLAYVRLADKRDFGKVMITEGLCRDYSYKYKHPRQNEY